MAAEEERIKKCRGRVFALKDEPEVYRVWLPNCDSPGLAMARAFGDFCLKNFGLISVPDVSFRRLTQKDEFIVLASDGVIILSFPTHSLMFVHMANVMLRVIDMGCTLKRRGSGDCSFSSTISFLCG